MRKLALILSLVVSALGVAQQESQYSNYQTNNFMLNPAVAGSYSFFNAKIGTRQQWVGIDDAPRTFFATFHAPIHHPDAMPRTRHEFAHHGAGFTVYADQSGAFKTQSFLGTYAFHKKLGGEFTLSTGASIGLKSTSVDGAMLEFVHTPVDQNVGNSLFNKMTPDANMGVWLYSDKMFAGFAGRQLLGGDFSFSNLNNDEQRLVRHYFATAGAILDLDKDWHFVPSFMVQAAASSPVQVDLNGTMWYQKQFAVGLSYRHLDALYIIVDYSFQESLEIGYAYDFNISGLSQYNSGTHEIIVGYAWGSFGDQYKCPGNFW